MKKILYGFAVLLALLNACSAEDFSDTGEKGPLVTIFSYAVPAGTDEDATANLRFVPNQDAVEFYVLVEKKADKDAFLASHSESEYVARVIGSGTKYSKDADYLNETLAATYAVTAVGVSASGEKGRPVEFIFNGVEWELVGEAIYTDPFSATLTDVPVKWYVSTNQPTPIYKLENRFAALDVLGYNLKLNWDETTGAITFYSGFVSTRSGYWDLETPFTHSSYGMYYEEVDLDPEFTFYDAGSNVIQLEYRRVVSAGTFSGWYDILIYLPD
jgi:hypothetical protein